LPPEYFFQTPLKIATQCIFSKLKKHAPSGSGVLTGNPEGISGMIAKKLIQCNIFIS
jgi:hypothetical protein